MQPLNRLQSTLDSLPEKLRSAVPSGLERRPVVENTDLSKLTEQLARLERALRQAPRGATAGHRSNGSRPPAWDGIAPVAKTKATLQDAALKSFKREFFLLGESELVARYGVPTGISVAPTGTERWRYADPDRNLYLSFDLHWGRVVNVW